MIKGIAQTMEAVAGVMPLNNAGKNPVMGGFEEIFLNMQLAMGNGMSEGMPYGMTQDLILPLMQLPNEQGDDEDEQKGNMLAAEMLLSEFVPCDFKSMDALANVSNLNLKADSAVKEKLALASFNEGKAEITESTDSSANENKVFMDVMKLSDSQRGEAMRPVHQLKVSDETVKVLSRLKRDRGENTPEAIGDVLTQPQVMNSFETASKKIASKFPSGEELANQVQQEMKKNIALGKKEFTVKIKPEGIGEIVVKLSEEKNFVSLKIIAASSATAKLISAEVMALQEALKPLNAAVVQIENIEDKIMPQFSNNADMGNHNQFSNQSFFDKRQGASSGSSFRMDDEEEEISYISIEDDKMDTYI